MGIDAYTVRRIEELTAEVAQLKEDYGREFEHAKSMFANGQSFKQRAEQAEAECVMLWDKMLLISKEVNRQPAEWVNSDAIAIYSQESLNATPQTAKVAAVLEAAEEVNRRHYWDCGCEHCEKLHIAVRELRG